jgi:hypothetical protein
VVEMISIEKWKELLNEWEKIGPAYQVPYRSEERLAFFIKHALPHLKDKKVLEIGCNAGIFGYHIAQVAETYTGLEPGNLIKYSKCSKADRERRLKKNPPKTDYFKHAEITLKYMPDNSLFVNRTIKDFIKNREKYEYNAFVACYALYHFGDEELNQLCEYIFPECDTVIIQTRHQRRPSQHNKYKFWKPKNVEKFFAKIGFNVEHIVINPGTVPKPSPFSIQVCKRLWV